MKGISPGRDFHMKPVNIYALTRVSGSDRQGRLERQMSGRGRYLKIKEWEITGLKSFITRLGEYYPDAFSLNFYYSFSIPKLGKEFDLIRVSDDYVLNVELKSGNVSDEAIRRQLSQNRSYIASLGRSMYFYTYVSDSGRLVRLAGSGRLVEAQWDELAEILKKQIDPYEGEIEDLFKEELYLISPLSDPAKFLRGDYFLTSQQKDIRKQILKQVFSDKDAAETVVPVFGFTGLPGTGKTILLYDLAMTLSKTEMVCVFHFGSREKELEELDERLKRIDFYYCLEDEKIETGRKYYAIMVDEGHRAGPKAISRILELSREWKAPVIFAYDSVEPIAPEERGNAGAAQIEDIPGFIGYHLTNRIRLNSELSSFISCVMCVSGRNHRRDYPNVTLFYAGDDTECENLLEILKGNGYVYLKGSDAGTCKEFEKVAMVMGESYVYDEEGFLKSGSPGENRDNPSKVRELYHGLSRAKKKIAIVVKNNEAVFDRIIGALQR